MYTGLEEQAEQDQWVKLLPFTLIVIWYLLLCLLFLTLDFSFENLTIDFLWVVENCSSLWHI